MLRFCFLLILICCSTLSYAAGYTPKPGSQERKNIMDAARIPIKKDLAGQDIVFVVRKLKVLKQWAYLEAVPQLRNGGKVNYKITKFNQDIREGLFDEWVGVLLKRENGEWWAVVHVIGATDYPVVGWPKRFGAPKGLFQ